MLTFLDNAPDQLLDTVYKGLIQNSIRVTDFNYSPVRNSTKENGKIVLTAKDDKIIGQEGNDGMVHLDEPISGLKKFHKWLCSSKEHYDFDNNALERLDDFDLIIVGQLPPIRDVGYLDKLTKIDADRIALLDGRDDWYIRKGYGLGKHYFKRELMSRRVPNIKQFLARRLGDRRGKNAKQIISYWKNEVFKEVTMSDPAKTLANLNGRLFTSQGRFNSINLTVGSHAYKKYTGEKEYDLFMITSSGSAERRHFAEKVREFSAKVGLNAFIKVTGSFYGGVPWNEYIEIMQKSKISISYPGNGFDTIRYWEIPYYGSTMASPYLPILIDNNFNDMESAIFFSNFGEFKEKILKTINENLWESISIKGQEKFLQHHTEKSRAKKIIDSFQ